MIDKSPPECNCVACQMLKANIDPKLVATHNPTYGCYYCAMTGFEDYPSCKVPCRLLEKK